MAYQQLSPDALMTLIKAMGSYRETLMLNVKNLNDAANVCSQAMGNDGISKKHIEKLRNTIEELKAACSLADEAIILLRDDYKEAVYTFESI